MPRPKEHKSAGPLEVTKEKIAELDHPHGTRIHYQSIPEKTVEHGGFTYRFWRKGSVSLPWAVSLEHEGKHVANIWVGGVIQREVAPWAKGISMPYSHGDVEGTVRPGGRHTIKGTRPIYPRDIRLEIETGEHGGPILVVARKDSPPERFDFPIIEKA